MKAVFSLPPNELGSKKITASVKKGILHYEELHFLNIEVAEAPLPFTPLVIYYDPEKEAWFITLREAESFKIRNIQLGIALEAGD